MNYWTILSNHKETNIMFWEFKISSTNW